MSASSYLHPIGLSIVGERDHVDFRDAISLLRASPNIEFDAASPELIVVAQSRPGQVSQREINALQRRWPLAGVVALLGSWCEGETRTGRPWPGVNRLYWYEFSAWWRRQLAKRAAGLCTDWARPVSSEAPNEPIAFQEGKRRGRGGTVVLCTEYRDTADALADLLARAGYAAVIRRRRQSLSIVRGAIAGIWDGGQLDYHEANDLTAFCRNLARDAAPVTVLLDFPRRERVANALTLGAATVLAKPWLNADLLATIERLTSDQFLTNRAA